MQLSERMREYELASKTRFPKRVPILIRADGKKFSKFVKDFEAPFDSLLGEMLKLTAFNVAKKLDGCVFFTQHSDEMSFFINTYQTLNQKGLMNLTKHKIDSEVASMITLEFVKQLVANDLTHLLDKFKGFDARSWVLPKDEVVNYFFERQTSSKRNSIQMYARQYFTQKEINGLSGLLMIEKMREEKNFDWESVDTWHKYGWLGYPVLHHGKLTNRWEVDEAEYLREDGRDLLTKYVDYAIYE